MKLRTLFAFLLLMALVMTAAIFSPGCAVAADAQAIPQTSDQGHWVSVAPTLNVFLGDRNSSTAAMPTDAPGTTADASGVVAGSAEEKSVGIHAARQSPPQSRTTDLGVGPAAPVSVTIERVDYHLDISVGGSASGRQGATAATGTKTQEPKGNLTIPAIP